MEDKAFEMLESDVREIKQDVKKLMLFMAVEQAKAKRNAIVTSGFISLVISLVALGVGKIL